MNTRAKMRRSNQKAIKHLLANGFDAVWLQPHLRWDTVSYFSDGKFKSKDMFGVGDGVAIKKGKMFLIQVKTNTKHDMNKFKSFCEDFGIPGVFVIIYDRRGAEAYVLNNVRKTI